MNWNSQPATESQPAHHEEAGRPAQPPPAPTPPESSARPRRDILIGKTRVAIQENGMEREIEVFTMSLGGETIELLPLKNWGQLDAYKWAVRGKLPGSPAGLDIAFDHVKMLGQTVTATEPEGCSKLEGLFNEWLSMEKEGLELARKKAQPKPRPAAQDSSAQPEPRPARFRVERDSNGQIHVRRFQGKEMVAEIGLNVPGFNGLCNQGLMRKPRKLQIGALHDWVELDSELFSFAKDNNDSAKLEKTLNEKYLPDANLGQGKDVVVFANAASSTGFDIQFPVTLAGVLDNRRRPLVEESLALLQDPNACGLLHKGLVIKLTRPTFVFKLKTPDGGERYLERSAEHTVTVTADDGAQKVIDLSQPVNYMRLTPIELTAVFNHPAINRHSQAAPQAAEALKQAAPPQPPPEPVGADVSAAAPAGLSPAGETPGQRPSQPPSQEAQAALLAARMAAPRPHPSEPPSQEALAAPAAQVMVSASSPSSPAPAPSVNDGPPASPFKDAQQPAPDPGAAAPAPAKPLPNSWLENVLAQPPIRHDWLACTLYARIAGRFGNSRDGILGLSSCWAVALDEAKDIADPAFKGIYLTEKHGFGFLCQGHIARFNQGVAFIGTQESAIQGIGVSLVAVGLDVRERIVFVITDGYLKKFGVPDQTVAQEFGRLEKYGAVIMSVKEALQSQDPIEVLWTVPLAQENPSEPQAIQSVRPAAEGAN